MVSVAVFIFFLAIVDSFKIAERVLDTAFVAMGFAGVFAGSLCLAHTSRRQGSIILLILGLLFYAHQTIYISYLAGDLEKGLSHVLWGMGALALGGLGAVILAFRLWPPTPKIESRLP